MLESNIVSEISNNSPKVPLPAHRVMVYLDYPVDKTIGESFSNRKYIFAQDLWHAQNPADVLSKLPVNVRQMLQRFYILKRPLNIMWAFLRITIGLPIELVIKIRFVQAKNGKSSCHVH